MLKTTNYIMDAYGHYQPVSTNVKLTEQNHKSNSKKNKKATSKRKIINYIMDAYGHYQPVYTNVKSTRQKHKSNPKVNKKATSKRKIINYIMDAYGHYQPVFADVKLTKQNHKPNSKNVGKSTLRHNSSDISSRIRKVRREDKKTILEHKKQQQISHELELKRLNYPAKDSPYRTFPYTNYYFKESLSLSEVCFYNKKYLYNHPKEIKLFKNSLVTVPDTILNKIFKNLDISYNQTTKNINIMLDIDSYSLSKTHNNVICNGHNQSIATIKVTDELAYLYAPKEFIKIWGQKPLSEKDIKGHSFTIDYHVMIDDISRLMSFITKRNPDFHNPLASLITTYSSIALQVSRTNQEMVQNYKHQQWLKKRKKNHPHFGFKYLDYLVVVHRHHIHTIQYGKSNS